MSRGRPQREIDRLADSQADLDFEFELAELPRLQLKLPGTSGVVRGTARFGREAGFAIADLDVHGAAEFVCQRCLGSMQWQIDGQARVALVFTDADADRVPEHLEPVLAPEGRLRLRDIAEEELLLLLPIVALHQNVEECEAAGASATPGEEDEAAGRATQRPFERLGELLKRND